MSKCNHWILIALVGMAAACSSKQETSYVDDQDVMDAWTIQSYQEQMIDQGIIAQHTLYPYHFVANAAELNELGARDLGVLARHYREHPGQLNLRRDNTAADLYQARVQTVRERLAAAGVDSERIKIGDRLAGGAGVDADRVLMILEIDRARSMEQGSSDRNDINATGAIR